MRILLVEDNSDHRELMRLALTGHDSTWEVEAVASGDEALRYLAEGEAYDVVFLDYSLPGRDGLEVLEEIRRGEAPPPVVVVTGRGDEQVAVKAMKGGAYDYVVKGEGYLQRLPVVAHRAVEAHQLAVERKRAEEELRESEERLRTIVEASLDAIIAVNVEGRLVLFNGAAQELFQYSKEEALNQPADILLREEIGKIHQERLEKFLNTGVGRCGHIGRRMEKPFRRKDGSLFEAEVSMSGGRLDGLRLVVLVIHDITERRQAEDSLHRSEENFRRSLDESPLGVRIVTIENDTVYANRAMLNIYGYDSIEELKTTPLKERCTPESYAEYQIREEKRNREGDGPSEYAISIVRKDGEVRHLHAFRKGILWNGEEQFQVIYQDITERKRAEEKIKASLSEKETMLKEIHHRVKNNLQVISSLLSLQSSYLQDERAIAALEESMERVETMASIHAQLYESQDLNRVDFGSFIEDLIGNIRQSYGRTESPVEIRVDAGEISLGIDNSIPCGLILNELVANAMKHAFPEGKEGKINITMRSEDNRAVLMVCDNGIGFPESIDSTKVKSLGLDLVNLLVAQMKGEIEMRVEGGTTWTITFPLKNDREWRNGQDEDHDC